jgi:hypothetical protein
LDVAAHDRIKSEKKIQSTGSIPGWINFGIFAQSISTASHHERAGDDFIEG